MKKAMAGILALALAISCAGCGEQTSAARSTNQPTVSQAIELSDAEIESFYNDAKKSIRNGNYDDAVDMLRKIAKYKNVSDLITYCNHMISYAQAKTQLINQNYRYAYDAVKQMPTCLEKADILNLLIEYDSVDLTQLENDFENNKVRAEQEYKSKFFIISGVSRGTSTAFFGGDDYLQVKVGSCSNYAHCYGLTQAQLVSIDKNDYVNVAGLFVGDYGFIGIDFESCTLISDDDLYASRPLADVMGIF